MSEETNVEKVAILLDIQNLYHGGKALGDGNSKINFKKLIESISKGRVPVFKRAYAAYKDIKNALSFYSALEQMGVEVIKKKVHVIEEKGTKKTIPVYFSVEIATDASWAVDESDTVVICTGNGEFSYLVKTLREKNFNVEIWGFEQSTSTHLKNSASKFVPITEEFLQSERPSERVCEIPVAPCVTQLPKN